MITVYGIKNCDTVKKALKWLDECKIEYQFHDYKKAGVDVLKLEQFVQKFGWQNVLNRRGTTWKSLGEEQQQSVIDNESAIKLMVEKPSIIKRPIIDLGKQQILGFDEKEYNNVFTK